MATTVLYYLCESEREKVYDNRSNTLSWKGQKWVYNYLHGIYSGFSTDYWNLTMHAYQVARKLYLRAIELYSY